MHTRNLYLQLKNYFYFSQFLIQNRYILMIDGTDDELSCRSLLPTTGKVELHLEDCDKISRIDRQVKVFEKVIDRLNKRGF